jgi:hypothetical protein
VLIYLKDVIRWKRDSNPFQAEKKMGMKGPEVAENFDWLNGSENGFVWLGHACFFMRINGVNLITDPVFEKLSPFHKRYTTLPFHINELPQIDYILLSHNHRDHLSGNSLKNILKKNNGDTDEEQWAEIPAITGDVIFFPGWLQHRTQPNTTDRERWVVSTNYTNHQYLTFNNIQERRN